ncbi:MAG: imidazole glycerol phosphate synthase subunit HisH [Buchnera aphidicola (Kaburagia rhusicola rhusicola)]
MRIVIINTGCSNLSSIRYAICRLGYNPIISSSRDEILRASKIVLPGVGTAYTAMHALKELKLLDLIKTCQQPLLGICLGMQLLASFSHESSGINMLDIVHSPVCLLDSNVLPLPHNGWNNVEICKQNMLFKDIDNNSKFYFLHSYVLYINKYTIAQTLYNVTFSSAIQKNNFFGVQFHPEKSGDLGLKVLKNFLEI